MIVTFNTKHFPPEILAPFQVAAVTPDTFAYELMEADPRIVASAAADHRGSLTRPSLSPTEYLHSLSRNGLPGTAARLSPLAI